MKFEEVLYTQKAYHHKPTFLPTRATAKRNACQLILIFWKSSETASKILNYWRATDDT